MFAATALFGLGLWMFREVLVSRDPHAPVGIVAVIACFGAACGIPFRRATWGAVIALVLSAIVGFIALNVAVMLGY